jgi:hypothetical protein
MLYAFAALYRVEDDRHLIFPARPGAANMKTGSPTASSRRYPKISSAALFQVVMIPSKLVLMIASFDDSTIAAGNGQLPCEKIVVIRVVGI